MNLKISPHLPAVGALGLGSQIGQIVLLRELLMVFHGNELSIGIILASWMMWVGIGSYVGARWVERVAQPVRCLVAAAIAVLLLLPVTVLAIRSLRGLFDVLPGTYLSLQDMLLSCLLVLAPVCLVLGVEFILLARLWREQNQALDTTAAGKTYSAEAGGTVVGGILFSFVLVQYTNSFQSTFIATGLLVVALLALTRNPCDADGLKTVSWRWRAPLWSACVAAAILWPFLGQLDTWAHRLQWHLFAPHHSLMETHTSKYGTIYVVQREGQYSFFQSGHLIFSAAGPEAETAALEDREGAEFAHFALTQHADPERVLLIGGGLRGTLREMIRHPINLIDYLEMDDVLVNAARPYVAKETLDALDDPRVRLQHVDGRLFVKATDETYDLIIADVPDPATAVLNRYYTKEFFREASERLNPGGVLVIGAMSTPDLRGSAVANRNATLFHTLDRVFPHVVPVGGRHLFFFASHDPDQISVDPSTLRARFFDRDIATNAFSHHQFDILLEPGPLRRINWILRHHGRHPRAHLESPEGGPLLPSPIDQLEAEAAGWPPVEDRTFINSDFKPIGYYYTLVFWNVLTRADHGGIIRRMARVQPWWIFPVIGLAWLAIPLLRGLGRHRGKRLATAYAVRLTVFTTGLSTMALQIALLFSFQSIYGFVYEMVGLIMALFMGGLLSGTLLAQYGVTRKTRLSLLAGVQLAMALFATGIAVVLPMAAALTSPTAVFAIFAGLTFLAGLLNGVDFPLVTACCLSLRPGAERATGTVYGIELFGACIGAALASAVIAPVLGIVACCLLAALANGTACCALMTAY